MFSRPQTFKRWPLLHYCLYSMLRQRSVNTQPPFNSQFYRQTDPLTHRELHSEVQDLEKGNSSVRLSRSDEGKGECGKEVTKKKKLGPWRPLKRLTRYEMNHLRSLRELQPEEWTDVKLATRFGVSQSAVHRILRSKFDPGSEVEERQERKVLEQRQRRKERLLTGARNPRQLHHTEPQS